MLILSKYRFPTEPEAGGEDGTCLWSDAFPAHGNGGQSYEDWNSYSCVTIYEAAALSLGAHPRMIDDFLTKEGGSLQRGIFSSLNSNLIRAVLSGSIRTIVLDTPLDKSSITCDTSVHTEDVYKYFENMGLLNQESLVIIEAPDVALISEPTEKDTHPKNESVTELSLNINEFNFSGLLNTPKKTDDWFYVIDDMTQKYYDKHDKKPNEIQAWCALCSNPPEGYMITIDSGKDSLNMHGAKSLSRSAFTKRWKNYTTNNT